MTSYLADDARLIRSMLTADARPPDDAEALFLIYAVLMRAKGTQVTCADVHNAWVAWMQIKDRDHPALAPFEALESATQRADEPYVRAIRRAAEFGRSGEDAF